MAESKFSKVARAARAVRRAVAAVAFGNPSPVTLAGRAPSAPTYDELASALRAILKHRDGQIVHRVSLERAQDLIGRLDRSEGGQR
jgi:hypothetical protein